MLADSEHRPAPARRTYKGAWGHLRDALLALGAGRGVIVSHAERPSASVTFEGARHTLAMTFEGSPAIDAGELMIEALPEHEFTIPGQLVAEARVTGVDQRLAPDPRMTVTCELLLLKDA